jgi:hypothetical protein
MLNGCTSMKGLTPKAHDAVAVFGHETYLMRRLPVTLEAESTNCSDVTGNCWAARHGLDDAAARTTVRTSHVRLDEKPVAVFQSHRGNSDLPKR